MCRRVPARYDGGGSHSEEVERGPELHRLAVFSLYCDTPPAGRYASRCRDFPEFITLRLTHYFTVTYFTFSRVTVHAAALYMDYTI